MDVIISSRRVTESKALDAPRSTIPDDLLTRIAKLIPGEVTAAYTALIAIMAAAAGDATVKYAALIALIACGAMVVLLLRRAGALLVPPEKPRTLQYVVSFVAFIAWAFAIHNPLAPFGIAVPSWIPGFAVVLVPIIGGLLLGDETAKPA